MGFYKRWQPRICNIGVVRRRLQIRRDCGIARNQSCGLWLAFNCFSERFQLLSDSGW